MVSLVVTLDQSLDCPWLDGQVLYRASGSVYMLETPMAITISFRQRGPFVKRNVFRNMFRLISILRCFYLFFVSSFSYPDPYVRTQLVIDEKVMKTKKTTTKKNTLDPVFNESFSFNVAPSSLKSVSVIASVWDYNSKGKDNFVGQVIMGKHLSGK